MKLAPGFMAFSLAAILIGCAGQGNDSGSTGSTGGLPTPSADTVVEAIVAPGGSIPSDPASYVYQDPQNIEANQTVQFQLASYDSAGKRTILPATDWSSSDTSSSYGSLGLNSGLYIAGSVPTVAPFFVGTSYLGKKYYAPYSVKPRQATLVASVVNSADGKTVRGVMLEFYDSDGVLVGKVQQPNVGVFRASVPLNAKKMLVISESIPSSFRKVFEYNSLGYQAGDISCSVTLPTLTVGTNNLDSNILLVPKTAPEPDLTGCGL